MSEPQEYTDHLGVVRKLGMIPADSVALKKRGGMMSFAQLLQSKGLDLIPESKWVDIDASHECTKAFTYDQGSTSSCVGASECAAEVKTRSRLGMKFERLSPSFTYAFINGGRDSGAMIIDAMYSAMKNGHCLESEFNYPKLFRNQIPDSAIQSGLTRQSTLAFPCDTIEEAATAIQMGFVVQHGVMAGGSFGSFDGDGVSRVEGGYANHSVHSFAMKKISGKWRYHMGNTWGNWGPFGNGTCYLKAAGLILQGDAFVHVSAERLTNDLPTPHK